ncbi:hypothetical protein [Streptomyces sp. B21-083]|uniref:hypothetical protein n=1 Tax=Streptomyces sp. B21-083 TaxID=3039410 RepID=UPI002FF00F9E
MSSSDGIERAMRKQRDEERAAQEAEDRRRAELFATGAEAARGFIELMRKHGVQPETVYDYEQVKRRKYRFASRHNRYETIEQYTPVGNGWVVQYSLTEYDEPWLIKCLQEDGKVRDCTWHRPGNSGFPTEGLLPPAPRSAIPKHGRLGAQRGYQPGAPTVTVEQYATAARWYLG